MRGRPPHIREEVILDAARDVFLAEGLGATTAKIAERAGVSEGILFYRYKTKEALFSAVIERETRPPRDLLRVAQEPGEGDLSDNLERIALSIIRAMATAHPFLVLAESSMTGAELRRLLDSGKTPPPVRDFNIIKTYLEGEVRRGRIRGVRPESAARALFGACVDYVRSGSNTSPAAGRAFARNLVDLLIDGLKKPRSRR